jgi:hypothetical protein
MRSTDIATGNAVASLAGIEETSQNQVAAIGNEVTAIKSEADNTAKLVKPAQQSANAATEGVRSQESNFFLDERPILAGDNCGIMAQAVEAPRRERPIYER